ncbi:hypothetical protein TWF106_000647 [Orbilia oligospora]|uniref:Uncharacterized protein n=1 Tax=Orbilia oligospora TaxID=2813651 RepID=A0A6G1M2W3_ORBOL|nr:hypothetical protein TWF679_009061 [Orbilia oligospora]KAF3206558.1 hypothetical protein TWF106_000647 [Orbilia oligospora]KAF3243599.1 hypothetical protein TWF192_007987 [Orbilia oligospora]
MQLKSLLFTTLLAGAASALPTANPDFSSRALCSPQEHTGFLVRINSTDGLNNKVVSISNGVVGVDLPNPDSVIWPYTEGNKIYMPGPGYKYLIPGYLYSTGSGTSSCGKQLKFSKDLPKKGLVQTNVFSTSCDIRGTFYLTAEGDWNWQACPNAAGKGWTIHHGAKKAGCRDVKLRMIYGPPY